MDQTLAEFIEYLDTELRTSEREFLTPLTLAEMIQRSWKLTQENWIGKGISVCGPR